MRRYKGKTSTVFEILLPDCLVDKSVINLRQSLLLVVITQRNTKVCYRHYKSRELDPTERSSDFKNFFNSRILQ